MNLLYSTVNSIRDRYTPVTHKSTFRETGHITPEEFVAAGDYIVFKFPSWSWADADSPGKRVGFLPAGKQYLVSRHVPCQRRLDDDFAGDAGHEESVVEGGGGKGSAADDEDGWLRTGGLSSSQPLKVKEVRTVDDAGNVGPRADLEEEDIPDMEDEDDDEAIIRDATESKNRWVLEKTVSVAPRADVLAPPRKVDVEPIRSTSNTLPTTAYLVYGSRGIARAASRCLRT